MVSARSTSPIDSRVDGCDEEIVTMPPLPDSLLDELEDLGVEGELIEVGLDETVHIWAILQIQRPLLKDQCKVMVRNEIFDPYVYRKMFRKSVNFRLKTAWK